jgi:hypothetical protein
MRLLVIGRQVGFVSGTVHALGRGRARAVNVSRYWNTECLRRRATLQLLARQRRRQSQLLRVKTFAALPSTRKDESSG